MRICHGMFRGSTQAPITYVTLKRVPTTRHQGCHAQNSEGQHRKSPTAFENLGWEDRKIETDTAGHALKLVSELAGDPDQATHAVRTSNLKHPLGH